MKITNEQHITAGSAKIFSLITDFNQFSLSIPPQVKDWQVGNDFCEFNVDGIATIRVEIVTKTAYNHVAYQFKNDKNIAVSAEINLTEESENSTHLILSIEADLPFFLQGMIQGYFKKAVDVIASKIKEIAEK